MLAAVIETISEESPFPLADLVPIFSDRDLVQADITWEFIQWDQWNECLIVAANPEVGTQCARGCILLERHLELQKILVEGRVE